eukprot:CAMPEP_0169098590 /NCGR_PEP_ID=MMETSP1015-20121227/20121_1 /TAXON_ID=342587 /ORGANISM="Karlodinium micrum, Strain CCMP2283" /LENGTH=841 /DNA_ID=CAMNT_0009159447 /DNA_START=43 /DNA_END=2568 /DNA_ORIENTATION=+
MTLPKVQELCSVSTSDGIDKKAIKYIGLGHTDCSADLIEIAEVPLAEQRTISQDVAARTGRSRIAARAALDALADDPEREEKAYNLLMSNLVLTVVDGLPCEAKPLCSGEAVWLPRSGEEPEAQTDSSGVTTVIDVGGLEDCYLLRIERGRDKALRIFALEPVQVLLLSRQEGCLWRDRSFDLASGWSVAPTDFEVLPTLSDEAGERKWMETRSFDPGNVTIPLQAGSDVVPLVRILKKSLVSPVRPPANTVAPSQQIESRLAEDSQNQLLEVLPAVPEDDDEDLEEHEVEAEVLPSIHENDAAPDEQKITEAKRAAPKDSSEEAAEDVGSKPQVSKVKDERPIRRARKQGLKGQRRLARPQLTYTLGQSVGEGTFGTVFVAEAVDEASNKQKVAVKCVLPSDGREAREVAIMKRLQHPFIIRFLDAYPSTRDGKKAIHIVMEFMPSNLHKQIDGRPLPLSDLRIYTFQLMRALAHLDGLGISHRDLKPQNILVDGLNLKLADFGSAKELDGKASASYICSRWWRAPELVLASSGYTTSVDWWSCGCVIAEMMLGKAIFRGASNWGQMFEIISVLGAPTLEEVRALSPGKGNKKLEDNLAKLAKESRTTTNWATIFPAYAGHPLALELLSQLLVWLPSSRLHPAHALSHNFFAEIFDLENRSSSLQYLYSGFSDEELSLLSPEVRAKYRDLEARVNRPMLKRRSSEFEAAQLSENKQRQPDLDSAIEPVTKRSRLICVTEMPQGADEADAQHEEVTDEVVSHLVGTQLGIFLSSNKESEKATILANDVSSKQEVQQLPRDASMKIVSSSLSQVSDISMAPSSRCEAQAQMEVEVPASPDEL